MIKAVMSRIVAITGTLSVQVLAAALSEMKRMAILTGVYGISHGDMVGV
jgi:hypothetical protein